VSALLEELLDLAKALGELALELIHDYLRNPYLEIIALFGSRKQGSHPATLRAHVPVKGIRIQHDDHGRRIVGQNRHTNSVRA
jgi:hypothetical protein